LEVIVKKLAVLTRRQREILKFITAFLETEGYAPSLEEIRDHFGLAAVSTVHEHVEKLAAKGYLTRGWNRSRSISLTPDLLVKRSARTVPLLGRVAAGSPVEAIVDAEEIPVPEAFLGRKETYALRVTGDSMVDEGILDGDVLIVEKASAAENGSLVIALIRGSEAAVKRFHRSGKKVKLVSANPAHPPMVFDAREVRVQGVVVGLLRNYR
jgi:repressor LexA